MKPEASVAATSVVTSPVEKKMEGLLSGSKSGSDDLFRKTVLNKPSPQRTPLPSLTSSPSSSGTSTPKNSLSVKTGARRRCESEGAGSYASTVYVTGDSRARNASTKSDEVQLLNPATPEVPAKGAVPSLKSAFEKKEAESPVYAQVAKKASQTRKQNAANELQARKDDVIADVKNAVRKLNKQ